MAETNWDDVTNLAIRRVVVIAPDDATTGLCRTRCMSLAEFAEGFTGVDPAIHDTVRCLFVTFANTVVDVIHTPEQRAHRG
jgi:hypothetical protein